jgi:citrate synthase
MTLHHEIRTGLDGVAAAATVLSHVDGERGELVIAGHRVADLAGTVRYEEVAGRLWALAKGASAADAANAAADAGRRIGTARQRAFARLGGALDLTRGLEPVVAMRAVVAALGPEDGLDDETALTGGFGVAAAALLRRALGGTPVAPDPDLPHAADMLRMIRGAAPDEAEAEALDAYLVTAIDHGMNASTFAGRVVASTGADAFMAATAAYCALTGPLHGGAPGPVLDMLDAIGTRERIGPWIETALARGDRLMGFGHRIYKVRDPRADVLRAAVGRLGGGGVDLGFAAEVEAAARVALARAKAGRALDTNVEFYTAILLDALKVPREGFTPVFAAARIAGWTAHAIEQQRTGRLLRPASVYLGAMPG